MGVNPRVRVPFQGRFPATPSDRDFLEVLGSLWVLPFFGSQGMHSSSKKGVFDNFLYMGDSSNCGTPMSHPKMIIFSRQTLCLLGTTILGNTDGKSTSLSIDPPKKKGLNLFFASGSELDLRKIPPVLRHCSKGQAFAHQDVAVHHLDLTDGLFLVQTILPIVNAVRGVRVLLFLAEIFAPLSTTFPTYSRSLKKQVRVCNLRVVLGHLRLEGLPLHAFRGADCQSDSDEFLANYCWWFRYPANHHLGCRNPCKQWDKLAINWCRISSINSSKRTNIENRTSKRDSEKILGHTW